MCVCVRERERERERMARGAAKAENAVDTSVKAVKEAEAELRSAAEVRMMTTWMKSMRRNDEMKSMALFVCVCVCVYVCVCFQRKGRENVC